MPAQSSRRGDRVVTEQHRAVQRVRHDLARNIPTSREFRITDTAGDVAAERRKWAALVEEYEHYSNPDFIHDFFGRMTREEVGQLAYKHTDHHLRQFGA